MEIIARSYTTMCVLVLIIGIALLHQGCTKNSPQNQSLTTAESSSTPRQSELVMSMSEAGTIVNSVKEKFAAAQQDMGRRSISQIFANPCSYNGQSLSDVQVAEDFERIFGKYVDVLRYDVDVKLIDPISPSLIQTQWSDRFSRLETSGDTLNGTSTFDLQLRKDGSDWKISRYDRKVSATTNYRLPSNLEARPVMDLLRQAIASRQPSLLQNVMSSHGGGFEAFSILQRRLNEDPYDFCSGMYTSDNGMIEVSMCRKPALGRDREVQIFARLKRQKDRVMIAELIANEVR